MKMLVSVFIITIWLASCHHGRTLSFENGGQDTAFVTWKIKADSIGYNELNLTNTDSMTYVLVPASASRKLTLTLGDGLWTPSQLSSFLDDFEYLEIKTSRESFRLNNHEQMMDYLMDRRKNMGKSKIVVRL